MGVIVRGVRETIKMIDDSIMSKHRQLVRVGQRIGEDWLRKARDNAPVRTGALIDSGAQRVIDKGLGNGIVIQVGFDTPYALKMHETHYTAHDPHERKKKFRRVYQTLRYRRDGVTVTQEVLKRGPDGMWRDSRGNWRGRKYLQRATDANWPKYKAELEAVGDR